MISANNSGGLGWRRLRHWLLLFHRYSGLFLLTFLVVAGLTGTVIAFYHELDAAMNPRLYKVYPPSADAKMLDPFELRERLAAQLPDEAMQEVRFDAKPGESLLLWFPKSEREAFIDPYSGTVLGTRKWGELSDGLRANLVPFIYRLHYSLALGDVGYWLFGIAALLWTIDCFVGAYLTFPSAQKISDPNLRRSWLRRWLPSWMIKSGQLFSAIFTFHRAAGLWVWAMLFVFAWSAVGFNLGSVFTPVMSAFGYRDTHVHPPELAAPLDQPALDWRAVHVQAKELMATEAQRRGFTIEKEGSIQYEAEHGVYFYRVYSSLDVSKRWPRTEIQIDGNSGTLLNFSAPMGEGAANTVASWLFALHMGAVGGWPYRIFVSVMGIVISLLAVSGVWIWWRKRKSRS